MLTSSFFDSLTAPLRAFVAMAVVAVVAVVAVAVVVVFAVAAVATVDAVVDTEGAVVVVGGDVFAAMARCTFTTQ